MKGSINDDRTVAGGGKDMILAGRYHILRQLGQGGMGKFPAVLTETVWALAHGWMNYTEVQSVSQ